MALRKNMIIDKLSYPL